jgi:hypothetical protein
MIPQKNKWTVVLQSKTAAPANVEFADEFKWLVDNDIEYKCEPVIIHPHANARYSFVTMGERFTFTNQDDAALFKLWWG